MRGSLFLESKLLTIQQGRPTRGPRDTCGPPKVSKWPAKGFYIGWLIDCYALPRCCELQKRFLTLLYLCIVEHHKIHQNWWTEDLFFVFLFGLYRSIRSGDLFLFFGLHLVFGKRNQSNLSGDLFFFGLHLVFGKRNRSNLSEDLFWGEHHKILRKTLVLEEEVYLRLNFGPQKFWNTKFGP